jgi:hypothetical protein
VPDQAKEPVGRDDERPTWDFYRRMASSTAAGPGRRAAVMWALDELERRMGPDWLERYWFAAGHVPEEVNLGFGHLAAFGNLLDFALRLHVLDRAPGIGQVQREMRTDLRDERRLHSALQLEIAALGMRAGFAVALESRVGRGSPPSDVVMLRDEERLQVETFAILRDEGSQEAARYWDWLLEQVQHLMWRHDVGIDGDISQRLDHDGSAELLRLIDAAARSAVAAGNEQALEFGGSSLRVLPPGNGACELRGGVEESKGWPRIEGKLVQKADQASAAGGGWLRADVRDGTWQFTPWAKAGLRAQIDEIAQAVKAVHGQLSGIDGVVLSSGALLAQGEFRGESVRTPDECYGLRRVLPAARVRETMIVPLTPRGREQANTWRELYNDEESWLDRALKQAGLPPRDQIFSA